MEPETSLTRWDDALRDVTPIPLVTWDRVVQAYDPSRSATRGRYRTLRARESSSGGLKITVRTSPGAASGSVTLHSVLSVLAIQAERDGDQASASQLVYQANALEKSFASSLKSFLATHTYSELEKSDVYDRLAIATREILENTRGWARHVYAAGRVRSFGLAMAQLDVHTRSGAHAIVEVQRELVDNVQLTVGDSLFLFQRMLPAASVLEVLPAAARVKSLINTSDEVPRYSDPEFEAAMSPSRDEAEVARLVALRDSGLLTARTIRLTA